MASWKLFAAILVIALLGVGLYNLTRERRAAEADVAALEVKFEELRAEQEKTVSEIEYYSNPENRIKEAKRQQNFIKDGETLVIIVPEIATGTEATSAEE